MDMDGGTMSEKAVRRWFTGIAVGAVVIVGLTIVYALFFQPDKTDMHGIRERVITVDGREIKCVTLYDKGISCDWRNDAPTQMETTQEKGWS